MVSICYLFCAGIGIWGIDWPVVWGFAILSYVWWIAIASGGTFISALFFLVRVEWRTSINRVAESMMLFGAAAAGVYPILHLGRPWFAYWLFFYPNTMGLWPQFRSPLLWDFWALYTYVLASVLYLVPGRAPRSRDGARSRQDARAQGVYGFFAMGFRGSSRAVEALPRDLRHHGRDHGAGGGVGPQHRRARLRRRRRGRLALDRVPALLRVRRAAVRLRRWCCCW